MNEIKKIGCCITLMWRWYYIIKVGFIGPGKVGVNLGRYFTHRKIKVSGYYGIHHETVNYAAETTNSNSYFNIKDIIENSNIIIITTPDDIISFIDKQLSQYDLKNKSICHASGTLKSTELINSKLSGGLIYSLHPIYAFSNKNIDLNLMKDMFFSIEGETLSKYVHMSSKDIKDKDDVQISKLAIINILKKCGNNFFVRGIGDGPKYHLANVFVSNLMLSLLEIGTSYLKELGLNERDAFYSVLPLIKGNLLNIKQHGFIDSLTGPVARGDLNTISKHLSAMNDDINKGNREIYENLSLNLLKLKGLKQCRINNDIYKSKSEVENSNINNMSDFNLMGKLNLYKYDEEGKENALKDLISNSDKYRELLKLLGGCKK